MTLFSKFLHLDQIVRYKKKSLVAIPFFFTFANAILGLLAVIKTLDSEFIAAGYCILLATFMDVIDGRLARAFGSSSVLGMELDSLTDAISFCLAPVVLIYSWEIQDFGILGFTALSIYLCSGLFRLAKFNISSGKQGHWFLGLPTPVAAFLVTSLLVHSDWIETGIAGFLLKKNIFFGLLLLISFLMISKIKFPAFKQHKGILFYIQFILFIMTALLCLMKSPYMIFVPILYIVFGFACCFYFNAKRYLTSKS